MVCYLCVKKNAEKNKTKLILMARGVVSGICEYLLETELAQIHAHIAVVFCLHETVIPLLLLLSDGLRCVN